MRTTSKYSPRNIAFSSSLRCEGVAGERVAGERVAGERVAGERVAGKGVAGEGVAGLSVAVGLRSRSASAVGGDSVSPAKHNMLVRNHT